ncbi:MAG: hypothetical protein CMC08_08485 [Flavobacteriaceae bacterium]|nr:hypothetical protein [Flavobacteriaceae bacterium]
MKTLYMVRHAKSSWKYDVEDHQRPLKGRGKNDAALVSQHVKNLVKPPQRIVSSDANRARTTASYFMNAFNVAEDDFELNHDLYDFSGQQVIKSVKKLDESLNVVMIVGHNHAFTSIVNMLGNQYIENLPTCGFVAIEFEEDSWDQISTGITKHAVFPRHLKD